MWRRSRSSSTTVVMMATLSPSPWLSLRVDDAALVERSAQGQVLHERAGDPQLLDGAWRTRHPHLSHTDGLLDVYGGVLDHRPR